MPSNFNFLWKKGSRPSVWKSVMGAKNTWCMRAVRASCCGEWEKKLPRDEWKYYPIVSLGPYNLRSLHTLWLIEPLTHSQPLTQELLSGSIRSFRGISLLSEWLSPKTRPSSRVLFNQMKERCYWDCDKDTAKLTGKGEVALSASVLFSPAPLQNSCGISEVWTNSAPAPSRRCLSRKKAQPRVFLWPRASLPLLSRSDLGGKIQFISPVKWRDCFCPLHPLHIH